MQSDADPYTDFSVHVAPSVDGGTDVAIFGELDLATVDEVEAALDEAIEAPGRVVIDLRACGFVDSTGIAALVKAAVRLHEQHRALLIKGVKERVMRIFEVAGIAAMENIGIEPARSSA
jgi:anti-sigma B factor antagonist